MAVINDKFQSQNGFESPNFTVDATGRITAPVLNVQQILLNGENFVQYVPPEEGEGGGGGADPNEPVITNSFETLAVTGGTFRVSYQGTPTLRVVNGVVRVDSVETGSLDNIDIGYNTAGQIRTYAIDMTNAPDSTASEINLNGANLNGDVNIINQVVLNNEPTSPTHATRKGYVDATATALAVAFGA